jgi:hypothetical protein
MTPRSYHSRPPGHNKILSPTARTELLTRQVAARRTGGRGTAGIDVISVDRVGMDDVEAVVAAMHGQMDLAAAAAAEASSDARRPNDDVPGGDAWARAEPEVGVSTRTLRR